jgi:hypothetical protein
LEEPVRPKIKRPIIESPSERAAFQYGIQLAAEVAADYDKYSSHSHLVSECILGKLNVLKGSPGKNPAAESVETIVARIEQKLDRIVPEVMFSTRHTNSKRSTGRAL